MLRDLKLEDLKIGGGTVAQRGSRVKIRYNGYLNRGDAFQTDMVVSFVLGERNTIAGLERGVEGMQVGGVRRLAFGPQLGYGDRGVLGVIPPNAKLVFEVELLTVE
jgi:FKBP-type peptidyl-prolyl cis-trans isomerase FkpA